MNPEAERETRRQVAERAAWWLLTLQHGQVSAAHRAEFVDWLRRSPLHISEMLRICQVERELEAFKGWATLSSTPPELPAAVIPFRPAELPARARSSWLRPRGLALLAAGLAAVCVAASLLFTSLGEPQFRTRGGERREVTLADGSVVELAPSSEVLVRYRKRERFVTLDHGGAEFRVAKDANRPFIVQAAATRVRAVGTVFSVARDDAGVSVTVVEGRVAVSQRPGSRSADSGGEAEPPVVNLQANEQVSISRSGVTSEVRRVDAPGGSAAAPEELAFDNETVAEVARRFNLQNATHIDILDARLAARRISGVFRGNDPQSFVAFIQAAADVRVTQRDYRHIVLSSPDEGGSKPAR